VNLAVTLLNTFVVVAVGAALTYLTNDRFKALGGEMSGLKADMASLDGRLDLGISKLDARLDAGMAGPDARLDTDIGAVRSDVARVEARLDAGIAAVRSDIVQLALAVGAGRSGAQG